MTSFLLFSGSCDAAGCYRNETTDVNHHLHGAMTTSEFTTYRKVNNATFNPNNIKF